MKIQLKHPLAQIPARVNLWDAGSDLHSVERVHLNPGARQLIDTGVAIELPDGYVGFICPRSGLAHKQGITVLNAPGVIDSGYRGSIMVNLINHSEVGQLVQIGDRIAQLVIQRCVFPDFVVTAKLNGSDRGEKGHGSSGK